MKNRGLIFGIGLILAVFSATAVATSAWMYGKVRDYERKNGVNVLCACSCGNNAVTGTVSSVKESASSATGVVQQAKARTAVNSPLPPREVAEVETPNDDMQVVGVTAHSDTLIEFGLSHDPEASTIRKYVEITPPVLEGQLAVAVTQAYDDNQRAMIPCLRVSGEFAFRTNLTLRIRKGLPKLGKNGVADPDGALAKDYVYSFKREDLAPNVEFTHSGRYLSPCGNRKMAMESVNCSNVIVRIHRVESRNIVQLLAREERVYGRYYGGGGDSSDTVELSGLPFESNLKCRNVPNVRESHCVQVKVPGQLENGVFLVGAGSSECAFSNDCWLYDIRRSAYRLVCISDIGLSVRTNSAGIGVWVTSLTTGKPMPGVNVELFSKSNVKVGIGVSDEHGWCNPFDLEAGEPFAVVATSEKTGDMTFMALSNRMLMDETYSDGKRDAYLAKGECSGFGWTERGIYRHEEKVFYHLLLRNDKMKAPKPFPVELLLLNPDGKAMAKKTAVSDAIGSLVYEGFSVPGDQPSGKWSIQAKLPGEDGKVLAETGIKIEEFAPPQIRVKVIPGDCVSPTQFCFKVSAEHLFGAPAAGLASEGAVVFEDVPFSPDGWKGYRFGDYSRGLKPCFRRIAGDALDASGKTSFDAPLLEDSGLPKAMVRATGQGTVFEDGGRPATARASANLHYYPYYIGSTLGELLVGGNGRKPRVSLACVLPSGRRVAESKSLKMKIDRIDSVYSYSRGSEGNTWRCERVCSSIVEDVAVETLADRDTEVELPISESGDYVLTVADPATGVSYGHEFYLGDDGDSEIRAPLSNPNKIALRFDKPRYRVGESPRLNIRSPFAGYAMVSVQRDREAYTEILELTNATCDVTLHPVALEDAPNLDVYVSVIQGLDKSARRLAARAHGQATIRVMPLEHELEVSLSAKTSICEGGGSKVAVDVVASGMSVSNAVATVTLVDEGINLLTGEAVPDPIRAFATFRGACHPLYDIYGMILPVLDETQKANGVKTGGGAGAEMLGRVSPVGTRRFKPLAMWKSNVKLSNGRAKVVFDLPEFVGEVRLTAVVYSDVATGSTAMQQKVSPKLVMMPDAPRFVAPLDDFTVSLPLYNRSGAAGDIHWKIGVADGKVALAADASTNVVIRMKAPAEMGQLEIVYFAEGLGESHRQIIELPVRPAVAWVETAGICRQEEWQEPKEGRWSARTFDTPLGEYESALRWLAEYRHGCLEQTCSRVFPLLAAGGILNGIVTNSPGAIAAGIRRVESMVRENDFVMWPDCDYPPWNREVSLYAAHFLAVADKTGHQLNAERKTAVMKFVRSWRFESEADISSYVALVLALFESPDESLMSRLFFARAKLSPLARARLACAYAEIRDFKHAKELLAEAYEPQSVKEAAFTVLAMLAVDPDDDRILPLIAWLNLRRDRSRLSWGTTEENAHALLAVGEFFQRHRPKQGEKLVSWRKLSLPDIAEVKDVSSGISIAQNFLHADGRPADLTSLRCGELLVVELTITSAVSRTVNDLVIEHLLPGAFDPVHRDLGLAVSSVPKNLSRVYNWVMRTDMRDDRIFIFSKQFDIKPGKVAHVTYPVRVVSAGEYVLPGASVEGMYNPNLRSVIAPSRIVVK